MNSQMSEMPRARCGPGRGASTASPVYCSSRSSLWSPPGSSSNPVLLGFNGGFLMKALLTLFSAPLPSQEEVGEGRKDLSF